MKKNPYTDKTPDELMTELAKLKSSQAEARFSRIGGKVTSGKEYHANKKAIARILTQLNVK